jgi:hypothetical protein
MMTPLLSPTSGNMDVMMQPILSVSKRRCNWTDIAELTLCQITDSCAHAQVTYLKIQNEETLKRFQHKLLEHRTEHGVLFQLCAEWYKEIAEQFHGVPEFEAMEEQATIENAIDDKVENIERLLGTVLSRMHSDTPRYIPPGFELQPAGWRACAGEDQDRALEIAEEKIAKLQTIREELCDTLHAFLTEKEELSARQTELLALLASEKGEKEAMQAQVADLAFSKAQLTELLRSVSSDNGAMESELSACRGSVRSLLGEIRRLGGALEAPVFDSGSTVELSSHSTCDLGERDREGIGSLQHGTMLSSIRTSASDSAGGGGSVQQDGRVSRLSMRSDPLGAQGEPEAARALHASLRSGCFELNRLVGRAEAMRGEIAALRADRAGCWVSALTVAEQTESLIEAVSRIEGTLAHADGEATSLHRINVDLLSLAQTVRCSDFGSYRGLGDEAGRLALGLAGEGGCVPQDWMRQRGEQPQRQRPGSSLVVEQESVLRVLEASQHRVKALAVKEAERMRRLVAVGGDGTARRPWTAAAAGEEGFFVAEGHECGDRGEDAEPAVEAGQGSEADLPPVAPQDRGRMGTVRSASGGDLPLAAPTLFPAVSLPASYIVHCNPPSPLPPLLMVCRKELQFW